MRLSSTHETFSSADVMSAGMNLGNLRMNGSKPKRQTAQSAIHFLKFRHVQGNCLIAEFSQLRGEVWIPIRDEKVIVNSNAIGCVRLGLIHEHWIVAGKLFSVSNRFDYRQTIVAKIRDSAF